VVSAAPALTVPATVPAPRREPGCAAALTQRAGRPPRIDWARLRERVFDTDR
jgi:hypothetical protein